MDRFASFFRIRTGEGKTAALLTCLMFLLFAGTFICTPVARKDDAERAVRASADMLRTSREFAAETLRDYRIDFSLRVDINTGPVIVGEVGSYPMYEYTAMGDAGKGKTRLVRAYRLAGERSVPEADRRILDLSSPLVGRTEQIRALKSRLSRLHDGIGAIVCITGEAGVGKSRLLREIKDSILAERLLWLAGNALSLGKSTSFLPFQQILRRYMRVEEEEDPRKAWANLEASVRTPFPEQQADSDAAGPSDIIPYLGKLLVLEPSERYTHRLDYLDAEGLRKQIFLSCRRFFKALAARQFPDLYQEIVVSSLSAKESAELLKNLLGTPHLPAQRKLDGGRRGRLVQHSEHGPGTDLGPARSPGREIQRGPAQRLVDRVEVLLQGASPGGRFGRNPGPAPGRTAAAGADRRGPKRAGAGVRLQAYPRS